MNKLIIASIFAGCLAFPTVPAFAGDASVTDTGEAVVIGEYESPKGTQLIVDSEKNLVRIIIEGKEIALIDANGLQVNGNIDYTGITTDIGKPAKERE